MGRGGGAVERGGGAAARGLRGLGREAEVAPAASEVPARPAGPRAPGGPASMAVEEEGLRIFQSVKIKIGEPGPGRDEREVGRGGR